MIRNVQLCLSHHGTSTDFTNSLKRKRSKRRPCRPCRLCRLSVSLLFLYFFNAILISQTLTHKTEYFCFYLDLGLQSWKNFWLLKKKKENSSFDPFSYPESSGFLVSGATPGRLWGHRILLPQDFCGKTMESVSEQPIKKIEFFRCLQSLPGVAPLTKKPEDSGYEIGFDRTSHVTLLCIRSLVICSLFKRGLSE